MNITLNLCIIVLFPSVGLFLCVQLSTLLMNLVYDK